MTSGATPCLASLVNHDCDDDDDGNDDDDCDDGDDDDDDDDGDDIHGDDNSGQIFCPLQVKGALRRKTQGIPFYPKTSHYCIVITVAD